ncbi:9175_t:CDS:2 [Funneliformis mosseae]|uniref:Snurportin-1 n=1 Tax=Funneliformis mosseae TaxID=27381 RepID=A0A9N9CTY1_FUNMO|nr:9175_t:CDS:2 [Funneliformis mosseae]
MTKASENCEELNNGDIITSQKSVAEIKLDENIIKKPAATVDEVTELLSATSVSASTGVFRHKTFKTSPLQLKGKEETQEERRKRALEEQKKRRRDLNTHARNLALFRPAEFSSEEDSKTDDESINNDIPIEQLTKHTKRSLDLDQDDDLQQESFTVKKAKLKGKFRESRRKTKGSNPYRNQVMHAEWMHEIPSDLENNWYVVLCPKGKRCLVISAKGKTVSRLRNGNIVNVFESILPAGANSYKGNKTTDYCILDCIYDQTEFTYYVLDLMCWKGHPIYDCDTEFRFYWLNTKFAEVERPTINTSTYTFNPLKAHYCDQEKISFLIKNPHSFGYRPDGLLFFNKHTQYVLGDTPLCGWVGIEKVEEMFENFIKQKK